MTYKYVRAAFSRSIESQVQFICLLLQRARLRTRITPCTTSTVIRADTRELTYPLLDEIPIKGKITASLRQYHHFLASTRAVKMKAIAPDIDQLAEVSWMFVPILP